MTFAWHACPGWIRQSSSNIENLSLLLCLRFNHSWFIRLKAFQLSRHNKDDNVFHSIAQSASRWRARCRSIRVCLRDNEWQKSLNQRSRRQERPSTSADRSAQQLLRMKIMVAWFVLSVLSQRVSPTTNLLPEDRWRICSSSWWSQSKDWDPSFFMESILILIPSQIICNLNFQYWANFLCFFESILSEWIFHHFDVTVIIGIIQHVQIPSNSCPGLSWNMVQEKSFSLKKFMCKPYSHECILEFSSRSLCQLNISPSSGTLMENGIVTIDTTLGFETPIHHSSPQSVLHVLVHEWFKICWPNSSHQRYCPVGIELFDGKDYAKQSLCRRRITVLVVR